MSDATDHDLPPLGTPTPGGADRPGSSALRRAVALAAAVALLVGLAAGFGLAAALDDDSQSSVVDPVPRDVADGPTVPPTSQEAPPEECVTTMRSVQQTLTLLDQGLRDLRNLDLKAVDGAVTEVQRLRVGLDEEVRRCLDGMGD